VGGATFDFEAAVPICNKVQLEPRATPVAL
jgi:hypothetical protein